MEFLKNLEFKKLKNLEFRTKSTENLLKPEISTIFTCQVTIF